MDTGRQVIRYGIPGAFAMLWGTATFVVAGLLRGTELSTALAPLSGNISVVVAIAGSVPIGWGTYQIYYTLYGPLIFGGRIVRRDRGYEILQHLAPHQRDMVGRLFPEDLGSAKTAPYDHATRFGWQRGPDPAMTSSTATPYRVSKRFGWRHLRVLTIPKDQRRGYAHMWRIHWEIVCALINLIMVEEGPDSKKEYTDLSDTYHGIGAARAGMWVGLVTGILGAAVNARLHAYRAGPVLEASLLMLGVALIWGFVVLHRVRRRTWISSCSVVGRGLRLYFATNPDVLRKAVAELEQGHAAGLVSQVSPEQAESGERLASSDEP